MPLVMSGPFVRLWVRHSMNSMIIQKPRRSLEMVLASAFGVEMVLALPCNRFDVISYPIMRGISEEKLPGTLSAKSIKLDQFFGHYVVQRHLFFFFTFLV